jgi:hypothetical protein
MRVFSTLMPRSNENKSCMRVKKREFAWEFSQLSCPRQTRTRVAWELRSKSLHESFLNSHALVSPRTRVAWELRSKSLHESCRVEKRELHESWWKFTSESLHLSCPGQTRTRVAWELRTRVAWELIESWVNITSNNFHFQLSSSIDNS